MNFLNFEIFKMEVLQALVRKEVLINRLLILIGRYLTPTKHDLF
ncbi:MAG: hypothetical protein ACI97N_002660 [Cognaticolwellia sp.]|jgi:hypothetical protein